MKMAGPTTKTQRAGGWFPHIMPSGSSNDSRLYIMHHIYLCPSTSHAPSTSGIPSNRPSVHRLGHDHVAKVRHGLIRQPSHHPPTQELAPQQSQPRQSSREYRLTTH